MKPPYPLLFLFLLASLAGCTSQKKLAYLGQTPPSGGVETFPMEVPEYRLKARDVLYITIKAMGPEGKIEDFLSSGQSSNMMMNTMQGEGSGLYGYDVDANGYIKLPAMEAVKVDGLTLGEAKDSLQKEAGKVFLNSTVQVKLLSFKYTIIGEVKNPGTFTNYGNYLTILEAIGRAGGLTDVGNRDKILVVRAYEGGTKSYRVNLQGNSIFSSEVYTLLPNDVIIVEPYKQKVLTLNLPVLTSVIGTISTILLLVNIL